MTRDILRICPTTCHQISYGGLKLTTFSLHRLEVATKYRNFLTWNRLYLFTVNECYYHASLNGLYGCLSIVLPEVKTPNFGKVGCLRHCCQLFKWDYNESLHLKNSLISTLKKRRDYLRSKVLPIKMPEGRRRRILPLGCCFVGKEWAQLPWIDFYPKKVFMHSLFFSVQKLSICQNIEETKTFHFGKK